VRRGYQQSRIVSESEISGETALTWEFRVKCCREKNDWGIFVDDLDNVVLEIGDDSEGGDVDGMDVEAR